MRASPSPAWVFPVLLLFATLAPLAAPVAGAATDPNARDTPLATVGAVTGMAVARAPASSGGAVTAGTQDPGADEPTGRVTNASADVWYLWAADGRLVFDTNVDRPDCSTRLEEDCMSDVVAVGVSGDGRRAAAVGLVDQQQLPPPGDQDRGILVLHLDGAFLARVELLHEPVDLAVSQSGNRVAVLMREATGPTTFRANVSVYDWPSGSTLGNPVLVRHFDAEGTRVAISPDGADVAIVGRQYWHVPSLGPTGGTAQVANAVAVGGSGSTHWTVVGFDNDDVRLYKSTGGSHAPVSGTDAGEAVSAVALADDLKTYVAGDRTGRLHFHSLDAAATSNPGRFVAQMDVADAAIAEIALTSDGRYVALRAGREVQFHHWDGRVLTPLWEHTLPADPVRLGMSASGDLLAVAHGSSITVFDALHDLEAALPPRPTLQPNETRTFEVRYTNHGNRVESAALTARAPAGWSASVDPAAFTVLPGQSVPVTLRLTAPLMPAPGAYRVFLNYTLPGNVVGSDPLDVEVPLVKALRLEGEARSLAVDPGATVSFRLRVANGGNAPADATLRADGAPAGWNVDVLPPRATLAAGAARDVEVAVQAPADAAEGTSARIALVLVEQAGQRVQLTATVGGHFEHELGGPPGVIAPVANDTRATLTLRNTGNAPDSYDLSIGTIPAGWLVAFDGGQTQQVLADVEAGGTREVTVIVRPGPDAELESRHLLAFRSKSRAEDAKESAHTLIATVGQAGGEDCPKGRERNDEGECVKGSPGAPVLLAALLVVAAAALLRRRRD